jgi:hypothetical protein
MERKLKIKNVWIWSSHEWHNVHTKFHENPSGYSLVNKCEQADISCERLGWVVLVVRMRRWSWVISSSSHLTTLCIRHVGSTSRRNVKVWIWSSLRWHNIHTKFYGNPFSHFRYYMHADGYRVQWRHERSDTHAQKIIGSSVIVFPPHELSIHHVCNAEYRKVKCCVWSGLY